MNQARGCGHNHKKQTDGTIFVLLFFLVLVGIIYGVTKDDFSLPVADCSQIAGME